MKVEVERVARWLDHIADTTLDPSHVAFARSLARLVVDGALSKNVPMSAGKTFVPKANQLLTPEFIAECKAEELPNPADHVVGFVEWSKENRIQKSDWFIFFKQMLRKKKAKLAMQPKPITPFRPHSSAPMSKEQRNNMIDKIVNGKSQSSK